MKTIQSNNYCVTEKIKIKNEFQVLIQSRMRLNRAVDGDTVVIELLPESEWATKSELVLLDEDDAEMTEKLLKKNDQPDTEARPSGRIVAIIRRKWRQYCGIILANSVPGVS